MKYKELFKRLKLTGLIFSAALLFSASLCVSAAGGSKESPPPADVKSGAIIQSAVYGEVVIAQRPDGTTDYIFSDEGNPAVQQILNSMKNGENINYTKLIQSTATDIQRLTTYRGDYIENNLKYTTGSTVEHRGSFSTGAQYGSGLSDKDLLELRAWVSDILLKNNTANMTDLQKVRTAHDYLVKTVAPAPNDDSKHRGNAWGAIVYHEANSRGYARAMKALLDSMGVGCYVANASSDSALNNYSWNVVHVGEYWYIVDAFADDAGSTKKFYMISDSAYRSYGMRWNAYSVPEARYTYK